MKLPESLKPFAGRILDTDSHEQMPAQIWEREFGEIAKPLAAEPQPCQLRGLCR
jgi:hypothetical protein